LEGSSAKFSAAPGQGREKPVDSRSQQPRRVQATFFTLLRPEAEHTRAPVLFRDGRLARAGRCAAFAPRPADLTRLQAAVLPVLRKAVGTFDNDSKARDVSAEWKLCKISPIRLGTLGPAVVVEWNPAKAQNASMINIYLPANGEYQLLLGSAGFGPALFPGTKLAPDLVFWVTGGVCHAVYSRHRYQNGHYVVEACNQEKKAKLATVASSPANSAISPPSPIPSPTSTRRHSPLASA